MSTAATLTPLTYQAFFELGTGSSGFSGLGLRVSTLWRRIFSTGRAVSEKRPGEIEETGGGKMDLMQLSWIKVHCKKDRISSTLEHHPFSLQCTCCLKSIASGYS